MSNGGSPRWTHDAHPFGRQTHVEQPGRNAGRGRTRQLRRNIADQPMIGVAGAAIGSPGQHGIGMEPLQLSGDAIGQPVEQRAIADVVAEFSIGKAQQDRRPNTQGIRRAPRLFAARARELVPPQSGVRPQQVAGRASALRAIRRDDQVHLDSFAGVTGENRSNRRLIVRVSQEHGQRFRRAPVVTS